MKRISIFIILIFFASSLAFAQNIEGETIVGLNASQIDGDGLAGFNKAGLVIGAAAGFRLRDDFKTQFEITYNQRGSRSSEKDPFYGVYRFNYLEVPIIFRYEYEKNWIFDLGLSYDILLTAKADDGFGFTPVDNDLQDQFYGFVIGGGYQYDRFIFMARFQRSLSNMTKAGFLDRTINFSVRYLLTSQ